jgi:hypothetical protein
MESSFKILQSILCKKMSQAARSNKLSCVKERSQTARSHKVSYVKEGKQAQISHSYLCYKVVSSC